MLRPRRRLTKQEIKEDRFVTWTFKATTFVQKNMRLLIGGVVAILMVVFGSMGYARYMEARKARALDALAEAQILKSSDKLAEAIDQCRRIIEEFGGTENAGEALVMLGELHLETGAYEDARVSFRRYLEKYSDDETMMHASVEGIAASLEQEGQYEEAAAERRSFAERHRDSLFAPRALFEAARCSELAGRPDQARKTLQQLLDAYPESQLARKARARMEMLPQTS